MRYNTKYKVFFQKKKLMDIPLRMFNFKRSKWKFLKRIESLHLRFYLFPRKLRKKFFKQRKFFLIKHSNNYKSNIRSYLDKKNFIANFSSLKKKTVEKDSFSNKYNLSNQVTKTSIFHNIKIHKSVKKWQRFKFLYKKSLKQQKDFKQRLDNSILYKNFKNSVFSFPSITKYENFYQSLFQFEFRLNILLYRLRIFKTVREVNLLINSNLIKVNSKTVGSNYSVSCGDIITFDTKINYLFNLSSIQKNFLLKNFVEVDFYSNTIVILGSTTDIQFNDFSFFIQKYFDLNRLKYSFK